MSLRRYFASLDEETDCPECGAPVLFGDEAWHVETVDHEEAGFCCKSCAKSWLDGRRTVRERTQPLLVKLG